ncbi:serine hydrolase [Ottowia sp.]|uniref:serine hydrolase domain-containing protein n=1 Tax=Ottowia sp. TaxID=1898956 RepID=UPI0025CF2A00|nr:serine hydrolase domain-containing protein [Ottowia sp.]
MTLPPRIATLRTGLGAACLAVALSACGGDGDMSPAPNADTVKQSTVLLDTLVPQWLARTGVPGAAVSVVFEGKTVYAKGFGLRRVDEAAPVDADTVFQIASVSKPVGATVMAVHMPGADGAAGTPAIDWNTPIQRLLPDFRLAYPDPADNARLTLGELYAHRSGLPDHAGDVLEDMGYTRADILQRLRWVALKPYGSYDYTNFGLTAAAQAMAQAQGTDWATLSAQSLYRPLGMAHTSSRFADFAAQANRAWGHVQEGVSHASYGAQPAHYIVQQPPRQPDAQSPAGGVSSSVADMAQWMKLVLAQGQWQGRQLASGAALQAAMTARPGGKYGYGFNVGPDPMGHASVSHSGAFVMGAATSFILWPQAQLGITVLTNAQPRGLAEAIALVFGERAWGDVAPDAPVGDHWLLAMQEMMHNLYQAQGRLAGQAPPAQPAPPQALAAYAGAYGNAYFGAAQIALNAAGDGLDLLIGPANVRYALRHWDGDTFVFEPRGESAAPGSVSAVDFTPGQMQIELYSEDILHGRFTRLNAGS